jgi:hypothetical protein
MKTLGFEPEVHEALERTQGGTPQPPVTMTERRTTGAALEATLGYSLRVKPDRRRNTGAYLGCDRRRAR